MILNYRQSIRKRPSKDGKYLAFTITVNVDSKAALDEIYYDLTASPHVLMAIMKATVTIRSLSDLQDYHACWQAMKNFTDQRTENSR